MRKAISLHIGLNRVNHEKYVGWSGVLEGAETDAAAMKNIADSKGFSSTIILTKDATREALTSFLEEKAAVLESGDILLFTYAGHGRQIPDMKTGAPEEDWYDETWCLYDGQLIDDVLYEIWKQFKPGVRILVIADSCHSGTMTRDSRAPGKEFSPADAQGNPLGKEHCLSHSQAVRIFEENEAYFRGIIEQLPAERTPVPASVILISACQDHEYCDEYVKLYVHGVFTKALLDVWDDGNFKGNYKEFHKEIVEKTPGRQTPNLLYFGGGIEEFLKQTPFTV